MLSCDRKPENQSNGTAHPDSSRPVAPTTELTLYTSADTDLVKLVIAEFERQHPAIRVKVAGDTEATKNTGLVQRLLAEKDRPRADVWWSSEPFGTIRLAEAGIFEPYTSAPAETAMRAATTPNPDNTKPAGAEAAGWPAELRAVNRTWYAFAHRARVFVSHAERVPEASRPQVLFDLLSERFAGKVGIARPQFGTTGGHIATILSFFGTESVADFLTRLAANRVRIFEGNMAVVRAVANAEILVGLTDTDDVWAGQRNAWPVVHTYERNDLAADPQRSFSGFGTAEATKVGIGPVMLPNTAALVRGSPNPDAAKAFVDFLLSRAVQQLIAQSDSHNVPVYPDLEREPWFEGYRVPNPRYLDLPTVARWMPAALGLCEKHLPTR